MDRARTHWRTLLKASLFFTVWLFLMGLAYWYFMVKPQQWFDADMQQPPVLAEPSKQQMLQRLLQQQFPQLENGRAWFIRFKQSDCQCERFVELYHQSFAAQADAKTMQVVTLDLAKDAVDAETLGFIREVIPATPSVALFNPQGEVIYFGPYHQDGICNAENSYLEPVLASLRQGEELTVLNTLVYGCFCPIQ